jgi:hypothetical protein
LDGGRTTLICSDEVAEMFRSTVRRALFKIFPNLDPDHYRSEFADKSPGEIFTAIYRKKLWGGHFSLGACSGSGSRDPTVVAPYVDAVRKSLLDLGHPSVVDIGCGDFYVGSQLIDCCARYIACDVVDFVIAQNRRKYPQVDFRVLDAVSDDLPSGDVVLIRQVLQHLSNQQVSKILSKLRQYQYAIITEHIPGFRDFIPNVDKMAGADHRALS